MAQQQPARRKPQASKTPVAIPDKLYFRIGDVARLCSLPAYVLRFWETEFPQLKPNKGGTGQRLYRKRDVEMVLEIKRLLYDEGFTIAGARRLLAERRRAPAEVATKPAVIGTDTVRKGSLKLPAEHLPAQGRATLAAQKSPTKLLLGRPQISELRKEMLDLLALLGSNPSELKAIPPPGKRDPKKARRMSEPTLF